MNPIPRTIGRTVKGRNPKYSRLYKVVSSESAGGRLRPPSESKSFYLTKLVRRSPNAACCYTRTLGLQHYKPDLGRAKSLGLAVGIFDRLAEKT